MHLYPRLPYHPAAEVPGALTLPLWLEPAVACRCPEQVDAALLRAMAPLAALVHAERPQEIALAEDRPIDIDEAELGIC